METFNKICEILKQLLSGMIKAYVWMYHSNPKELREKGNYLHFSIYGDTVTCLCMNN